MTVRFPHARPQPHSELPSTSAPLQPSTCFPRVPVLSATTAKPEPLWHARARHLRYHLLVIPTGVLSSSPSFAWSGIWIMTLSPHRVCLGFETDGCRTPRSVLAQDRPAHPEHSPSMLSKALSRRKQRPRSPVPTGSQGRHPHHSKCDQAPPGQHGPTGALPEPAEPLYSSTRPRSACVDIPRSVWHAMHACGLVSGEAPCQGDVCPVTVDGHVQEAAFGSLLTIEQAIASADQPSHGWELAPGCMVCSSR